MILKVWVSGKIWATEIWNSGLDEEALSGSGGPERGWRGGEELRVHGRKGPEQRWCHRPGQERSCSSSRLEGGMIVQDTGETSGTDDDALF